MGRDAAGLADLRRRCAEVLRDGARRSSSTSAATEDALLAAIRFEPFPDAAPALRALRAAGVRLVVVSNWDVSLHEQLERDGPDAAARRRALLGRGRRAEAGSGDLHARARARGRAAGGGAARRRRRSRPTSAARSPRACEPVLIDRDGSLAPPPGVRRIASLAELPALCA